MGTLLYNTRKTFSVKCQDNKSEALQTIGCCSYAARLLDQPGCGPTNPTHSTGTGWYFVNPCFTTFSLILTGNFLPSAGTHPASRKGFLNT